MRDADGNLIDSPLPDHEQERLLGMSLEERAWDRIERMRPLPVGSVTTGAELWAANGGRSPNPDDIERSVRGYRHALDANGDPIPGMAEEIATGIQMATEDVEKQAEARKLMEMARQLLADAGL